MRHFIIKTHLNTGRKYFSGASARTKYTVERDLAQRHEVPGQTLAIESYPTVAAACTAIAAHNASLPTTAAAAQAAAAPAVEPAAAPAPAAGKLLDPAQARAVYETLSVLGGVSTASGITLSFIGVVNGQSHRITVQETDDDVIRVSCLNHPSEAEHHAGQAAFAIAYRVHASAALLADALAEPVAPTCPDLIDEAPMHTVMRQPENDNRTWGVYDRAGRLVEGGFSHVGYADGARAQWDAGTRND